MNYLVDTNVLLRSVQDTHPMYKTSVAAIKILLEQGHILCIIPQNLIEFWVVATRPIEVNGLGLLEKVRFKTSPLVGEKILVSQGS